MSDCQRWEIKNPVAWCSIQPGLCKYLTQWYLNGRLGRNWRFKSTMRAGWLLAVSNEKSRFVFGLLQSGGGEGGIRVSFHQFNASRWCWLMLQYFVVLSCLRCQLMIKLRKMAGPGSTLSDCSFFTIFPYFSYWVLAERLLSLVMYNFNVCTRGASKMNFIKCSLKLKCS